MPRKKVPPDQRQRSVIACVPCKRAKIRCDAQSPCGTCSKRGLEASCTYGGTTSPTHKRRQSRIGSVNSLRPTSVDNGVGRKLAGTSVASSERDNGLPITSDGTNGPRSRLLLSSKLQKVYVGETASLSYLEFLRQVVQHRIGACAFTEGDFNNFMLENGIPDAGSDSATPLEPHDKQVLAQIYLDTTSGILDFYTKQDILVSIDSIVPPIGLAATCFVLAIGAQCRGSSPSDLQHATRFFSQGQQLSFQGMLCDPSLEMVQNFLHMSFYMLGACHRNAGFMYLGIASQAAGALGLHRADHYHHLPPDEYQMRLSTWKSLRVLATIVNSILGRSCSLPGMLRPSDYLHNKLGKLAGEADVRALGLQSIFEICPFMDELETTICKQDAAAAEDFLQRLQKWSKALPKEIRTTDLKGPETTVSREKSIGRMHVACVYYFAVILVTRRFLTLYLLDRIQRRSTAEQEVKSKLDEKTISLAYVCLDGAVNLAQVGHSSMVSNQMLKNMCLLKAWMFAAGLLLGFAAFAQDTTLGSEVQVAFDQTKSVLRELAELSLQAGHYFEILSSLTDATKLYEKKLADERKKMTSQYLDPVFTTSSEDHQHEVDHQDARNSLDLMSTGTNEDVDLGFLDPNLGSSSFNADQIVNGASGLMFTEGFSWPADDLSFDWQNFKAYPDDDFPLQELG